MSVTVSATTYARSGIIEPKHWGLAAMFSRKRQLRFGFHLLFGTVATLTMGAGTTLSLVAQTPAQNLPASCDETKSATENEKITEVSPRSSLANYCLAESLFRQHQYQASANAFRFALHGDGAPSWTKVWSYIGLGKILDVTNQRERALVQYQLAIDTGNNTRGALDEAQQLLRRPYELP
jgi:hypothetical protein